MKTILIIIAFFGAALANAQKYELALSGGVNYTTEVRNLIPKTDLYNQRGTPLLYPATISLKLLKNHKKWQNGLSIDKSEAEYKHSKGFIDFNSHNGIGNGWLNIVYEVDLVSRSYYYPVKFLLNRKFGTGKYEDYAGLSAGYIFIPNSGNGNIELLMPFNKNHYYGLISGLQVGSTRYFTRHIGMNAELDMNYLRMRQGSESLLSFYTYSFNLGVRYRL